MAIIGGGVGGVGAAAKLKAAGIETFTLFEQSDGPGGTWRDNHYPGAGCDIPSHLYSFRFNPNPDWSRVFGGQPEILSYVERTVDDFGLRPHCRFGTGISSCRWVESSASWTLRTTAGEELEFDVVISALGQLNVPFYPDLPGMSEFSGPMFHTARWEHEHDLRGKRVAMIGTGSTAGQVVPAIAPDVAQLYVFQREPNWVLPKPDREFSERERRRFARLPVLASLTRLRVFTLGETMAWGAKPSSRVSKRVTDICLEHLEKQVEDPEVRAALTPSFPFFCKRPMLSSDYLPTFNRDNVELVPRAVTGFSRSGVIAADGIEREVDVVILGTGFQPWRFLSTLSVTGREGVDLHEYWDSKGGAEAFLGIAVPGFPNFYMLYGPNTNSATTSLIYVTEQQAAYALRMIRRMIREGLESIDVKRRPTDRYNAWVQRKIRDTAWVGGCHNYYSAKSGKVVTNWPATSVRYALMTRLGAATSRFTTHAVKREPAATATAPS